MHDTSKIERQDSALDLLYNPVDLSKFTTPNGTPYSALLEDERNSSRRQYDDDDDDDENIVAIPQYGLVASESSVQRRHASSDLSTLCAELYRLSPLTWYLLRILHFLPAEIIVAPSVAYYLSHRNKDPQFVVGMLTSRQRLRVRFYRVIQILIVLASCLPLVGIYWHILCLQSYGLSEASFWTVAFGIIAQRVIIPFSFIFGMSYLRKPHLVHLLYDHSVLPVDENDAAFLTLININTTAQKLVIVWSLGVAMSIASSFLFGYHEVRESVYHDQSPYIQALLTACQVIFDLGSAAPIGVALLFRLVCRLLRVHLDRYLRKLKTGELKTVEEILEQHCKLCPLLHWASGLWQPYILGICITSMIFIGSAIVSLYVFESLSQEAFIGIALNTGFALALAIPAYALLLKSLASINDRHLRLQRNLTQWKISDSLGRLGLQADFERTPLQIKIYGFAPSTRVLKQIIFAVLSAAIPAALVRLLVRV